MAVWKTPYLQPFGQSPYLFYAAFGQSELTAQARCWSGTLAEGLQVSSVEAALFREGPLWRMAEDEQPSLASAVAACSTAVVINGEVARHESLDYLLTTLELLAHLIENGAVAVYDPFALLWWDAPAWEALLAHGSIFNPFDHVALLASPEEGGTTWLHTRGMRKFGRPDLSVRGVAREAAEMVKKMLDRFINFQALGGVIEAGREVRMNGLSGSYRPGPVTGDLEDPDFNNTHIEIADDSVTIV